MIQLRCASPFQTGTSRTPFWISHQKRGRVSFGSALHEVWFDIEACFSAAAAADHQHVFIPCVLRLFGAAAHGKLFRLGQNDVVIKHWVNVRLDVRRCPP